MDPVNLEELAISRLGEEDEAQIRSFETDLPNLKKLTVTNLHQNLPFLQRFLSADTVSNYLRYGHQIYTLAGKGS